VLFVFDDEVLTGGVEWIGVEACLIGAVEAFAEFEIEDAEAQAAGGLAVFRCLSETKTITADLRVDARRGCELRKGKFYKAGSRDCRLNRGRCKDSRVHGSIFGCLL
jgi:hypothetical protein